jgi:3-phenylpropionate/trans-cinnamate dioxygenase ferredoxin subunit
MRRGKHEFVRVCAISDVAEESAISVVVDDLPIAVVRSQGRFYAIEDVCSHENVALSEGEVEDGTIECWLHGSQFNLGTGRAIGPPATRPVRVYSVKVEDGDVYVAVPRRGAHIVIA